MSESTRDAIVRTSRLVTDKIDAAPVAIRAMLYQQNHAASDQCDHAAGYRDFAGVCAALADEMRDGEVKTCLECLRAIVLYHSVSLANHQEAIRAESIAADSVFDPDACRSCRSDPCRCGGIECVCHMAVCVCGCRRRQGDDKTGQVWSLAHPDLPGRLDPGGLS